MRSHAILTGDLIGSTKVRAAEVDHAMSVLGAAAGTLGDWVAADTRFTRFRGDGWQIYLASPGPAFRACLYLTARMKAAGCQLETRISVGLGPVERLGTADLSDASGPAFTSSGHGLDDMPRANRLAISGAKWLDGFFSGIYSQAEFQARRWSREQAEAITLALEMGRKNTRPTLEDLSGPLGISRQALQARLNSAGYHALTRTLDAFERYDYSIED